jgi:carboxyl-terminal processing protease
MRKDNFLYLIPLVCYHFVFSGLFMTKKIITFCVLFFVVLCLPALVEDGWDLASRKMVSIISLVEENYHGDVEAEKIAFSSIRGMLQMLDPHSYFLDPRRFEHLQEESGGSYFGLGIMIQKHHTRLVVIAPMEGSPAYRLGVQSGDVISHINGESTEDISSLEAMHRLRGPKGTKVTITITREGLDEPFDLEIQRAEIALHSVPYAFMLENDIGYIFVRNFALTTADEFRQKMKDLKKQGMKKLVLDFRNNAGGVFATCIEVADEFLPKGSNLVSIKGRDRYYNRNFSAFRSGPYEDIPLVILIDRGTASAPEIVSGAIKDNDRGLIVGEDSFGKGLVQTVFPLAENAAVALTTAKYFTPSGRSIQRDFSRFEDYYFFRSEVPEDKREVTYTTGGRRVLGQGGIAPDYEVDFSFKAITGNLLLRGLFFSYSRAFLEKMTPLSKEYNIPAEGKTYPPANGRRILKKDFIIDKVFLQDFKAFLQSRKFDYNPEQFDQAEDQIKRELKRELVSTIWGIDEGVRVYRGSDPFVLKAISVFPEAEALIRK